MEIDLLFIDKELEGLMSNAIYIDYIANQKSTGPHYQILNIFKSLDLKIKN